jgi:predicted component of type VI protein secretion system
MPAHLEVWRPSGVEQVALEDGRVTLGRDPSNLVCVLDDGTVSGMHAVIEQYSSGWALRDLGSRNGTFVNGRRITGEQPLYSGDEIGIGNTRLVFRDRATRTRNAGTTVVRAVLPRPELTRRERDVLSALCRPLASPDPFRQPASIRAIANELAVTDAAVKQHLLHLYEKFGLDPTGENRRVLLANAVVVRGVLTADELQRAPST